jgi:hypothetical protein
MLYRRLSQFLIAAALAVAFVALAGMASSSEAKAQGYYRNYQLNRHQSRGREALRRHQQRERFFYGRSPWLRRHQEIERFQLRRHQRFERGRRFNNRSRRFDDCR